MPIIIPNWHGVKALHKNLNGDGEIGNYSAATKYRDDAFSINKLDKKYDGSKVLVYIQGDNLGEIAD